MNANAAFKLIFPAKALLDDAGPLRFGPHKLWIARTMGFAECMATSHQSDGLFVVHRHACKCFADVDARSQRIRITIWTFWVDVDQTHLHGGQWVFQVALAAVAIVIQPSVFRAPIDILFRLPNIYTAAAKAKGFEPHRIECDIAGQDHQIGP